MTLLYLPYPSNSWGRTREVVKFLNIYTEEEEILMKDFLFEQTKPKRSQWPDKIQTKLHGKQALAFQN